MYTLSHSRLASICDILNNAGQVFLASILVEPIVGRGTSLTTIIIGVILCVLCWTGSVYLSNN